MDPEIFLFLNEDSPVLVIAPEEPIPPDHTLEELIAVLRAGFAAYARYTGDNLGAVTNILVEFELPKTRKTQRAKAATPADHGPPASGPRC